MGGSFNPPHEGHVTVAATALRRLGLARVWWLVSPGNPLKHHDDLAPLRQRLTDVRNLAPDPRFTITDFEQDLATPYTAATLAFLKRRQPATRFVWVMGADNLATFHRWQHWRDIAETLPLAVVDRPGWHLPSLAQKASHVLGPYRLPEAMAPTLPFHKPPAWTFLTTRLSDLSSTDLRTTQSR